jgi:hypothetical protein
MIVIRDFILCTIFTVHTVYTIMYGISIQGADDELGQTLRTHLKP